VTEQNLLRLIACLNACVICRRFFAGLLGRIATGRRANKKATEDNQKDMAEAVYWALFVRNAKLCHNALIFNKRL
jgi:hypothetical protein